MKNIEIAKIIYEIAEPLEFSEIDYKSREYRRLAQTIEMLSEDIINSYIRGRREDIRKINYSCVFFSLYLILVNLPFFVSNGLEIPNNS